MSCFRSRWLRWALALSAVLVVGLGAARGARAFEFEDDGIIEADEVIDDDVLISGESVVVNGTVNGNVLASAQTVTVNGTVNGDLFVTGGVVTVNGTVNGSLAFAGQALLLGGQVGGSVYAAGGSILLEPSADVGRNVLFGGFEMRAARGSSIGRDVVASGYQVLLYGYVDRDVQAEVEALEIEGTIGRDVRTKVNAPGEGGFPPVFGWLGVPAMVPSGLRVAEQAQIGGTLTYISPVQQAEAIAAIPAEGVVYELPAPGDPLYREPRPGFGKVVVTWFLGRLRELVTLLMLGGLAVWRIPALLDELAERARTRPLPSIGWGFLTLIAGYAGILAIALFLFIVWVLLAVITLGGLARVVLGVGLSGLGLVVALFTLLVLFGSKVVVAYLAGASIVRAVAPQHSDRRGWALVVGVVLYVALRGIPLFGVFLGALVVLLGLGAMWSAFCRWRASAAPAANAVA